MKHDDSFWADLDALRARHNLSPTAERVLCSLITHDKPVRCDDGKRYRKGVCWPTVARLATMVLRTERTVVYALRELEEARRIAAAGRQSVAITTAVLGKAKVAGLLVDKYQDVTDRPDVPTMAEAAIEALSELSVSPQGVTDSRVTGSD